MAVLCSSAPILFNNFPNHKKSETNNLHMPKGSCKRLPFSEKVKVLDLIIKENNHMLRMLRFMVRKNPLSMKLWRKKKSTLLLPLYLKLQKLWSVRKFLVKVKKTLDLYSNIFWERERPHSFSSIYCYNFSILLLLF